MAADALVFNSRAKEADDASAMSERSLNYWILVAGLVVIGVIGLAILSQNNVIVNLSSVVLGGDGSRPSCDSVFNQDAYAVDNPLHPRTCFLRKYRSEDVVQCLGRMASDVKSAKNRNHFHIAFAGDSRIRQMYHSFSGMLPLFDANVKGHIHTREIVLHQDAAVTSRVLGLKVTFLWSPFIGQELQKAVTHWTEAGSEQAPDVLILGNLIWIIYENYHVENYANQLRKMSHLLGELTKTTKVIWWDQDQVNELNYHQVRTNATKADVNNKRIRQFNQAARLALQDTGVLIWNSTHTLLGEYIRACTGFPERNDPWRRWSCPDAVHASFLYAHMYNQRLLNYLCNPFMELGEEFCCHSREQTIFSTLKPT